MSYDLDVTPFENGRFGYGCDYGAPDMSRAWGVYRWDSKTLSWRLVDRYRSEATARSEAHRRDVEKPEPI
jgi:hypothetical protein